MSMLSRRKGKRGEIEATHLLKPLFPEVRTKRAGGESATQDRGRDLLGTDGWCVQVMLSKRPDIHRKYAEAAGCAKGTEDVPLALTRRDGEAWLATLPAERLVDLLMELSRWRVGGG